MNIKTKRISIAVLSVIFALSLALGVSLFDKNVISQTYAETVETSSVYYYQNLKDVDGADYALAKQFYDALDDMNTSGDFKDGVVERSLEGIVTSEQIEDWVINGDLSIPKAFSAARDSYYYDHPELFYVDLYKLTISAGRSNGMYSATIDCGLEADCYYDNGKLNTEKEVNNAIILYNAAIENAVKYAEDQAQKDETGSARDMLLATYANRYIAEHVSYDYEALASQDAAQSYASAYIGTAYGALVLEKCVCSGYSFAFKAVMDKLNVPCIVVSGVSINKSTDGSTDKGEAHSWNYVYLEIPQEDNSVQAAALAETKTERAWYAYDVTWNSTGSNVNGYVYMNAFAANRSRVADPKISTSNYAMPYPTLALNHYGNTTLNDEFMHTFYYEHNSSEGNDGLDDYGNPFMIMMQSVSYQGKSALELYEQENPMHIIYRVYSDLNGVKSWTKWCDLGAMSLILPPIDNGHETSVPVASNTIYAQFAVVDAPANLLLPDSSPSETSSTAPKAYYSSDYKAEDGKDLGEHMKYLSEVYVNKAYGTYAPAPYVVNTNPRHTGVVTINDSMGDGKGSTADNKAIEFSVAYDEELHVLDSSKPIGVEYVSGFANIGQYAGFAAYEDGSYVKLVKDENGKTNTLKFKFKPSLMYEHDGELYSFYFSNVGSSEILNGRMTNKTPNPVHFHLARSYMQCPLILGRGRLWIDCCAQPTLVSNSDLAAMDFKDPDGNSTFSEQARSQMMLVVNTVDMDTEKEIIKEINKEGLKNKDIKASETYDINLQICGKYPVIPDGSYVKIALGFPEGYGPEDEGVTFKLYHRKHLGNGKYEIEEVPCVVTQLGIVATVTSFSPYTVVVADAKKVSANKTICASIEGNGGTLSKEDGMVQSLTKSGKKSSYTYTITPDEGYDVYSVMLNGKDVTDSVKDGKLTVTYDELLNNNELSIKYISSKAAKRYADRGVEIVSPVMMVVAVDGKQSAAVAGDLLPINNLEPQQISSGLLAFYVILGCIAVVGIGAVAAVITTRRKKKMQAEEE